MSHEPTLTLETAALDVYQQVVYQAPDGAQRQDLYEEAAEILRGQYERGEIEVSPDKAIRAALHEADRQQGAAADNILDDLRKGISNLHLDGDPILRTVVTLGKGFRKSWEYVTATDLLILDDQRRTNLKNVQEAFDVWEDNLAVVLPAVREHTTVGDAVRAGAFGYLNEVAS